MKLFNIDYSLKNIPTPTKDKYLTSFMDKLSNFINNVRWKVLYFEQGTNKKEKNKENFGFKTKKTPPQPKSITEFESDLYKLAKNIKFEEKTNKFQNQMKKDILKINKSKNIFVKADKTSNIYEVEPEKYEKMLKENITSNYRKDNENTKDKINKEAADIATKLELDTKITIIPEPPAFVSIKDHKENFPHSIKCRLINPAKTEIGKISKKYLEEIVKTVKIGTNVLQWKNTHEVLNWFNNIENKKDKEFISLDIVDFYPSISEKILNEAIEFAQEYTQITHEQATTIKHARKSILFDNENNTWVKKENKDFDVSMGANDSAEICELVGIYMIFQMSKIFPQINLGLYRDDGLGTTEKMSGPEKTKLEKQLRETFKKWGFKITLSIGIKEVDFLDVNLNLETEKHKPFIKQNDTPKYINTSSNHPKNIIKQIPKIINDRLSQLSSTEEEFNNQKEIYQKQLKESGYKEKLKFNKPKSKNKKRRRNIIWFNPPFNNNVKTSIGKEFIKIIEKKFPPENKLNKILNTKTLKISYSCTMNMEGIIQTHNKKILRKNNEKNNKNVECNCRKKHECPIGGKCQEENIIYKATVKTKDEEKIYIGMTGDKFKTRYNNHKQSFNNKKYRNQTKLSSYVWEQKDKNNEPKITFQKLKQAKKFQPGKNTCTLCNTEKTEILTRIDNNSMLNQNTELANKCPHFRQFSLYTYKNKKEKEENVT